jgi:hypothetical protein
MPLGQYDFFLDSGGDWQKDVRLRDSQTGLLVALDDAVMEIRNTNFVLVMRLDADSGRCLIDADGATIHLKISSADSLQYFSQGNYPGAVQAVGFWGIGRAYTYDLFVQYAQAARQVFSGGVNVRALRGFFNVDPNISRPLAPSVNLALTIGQRGSYE